MERARSVAKERGKKVFAGRLVFPSFSTKRFPLFLALSLSSSLVFLFFFFLFGPWSLPWPSTRRACLQGKRERERDRHCYRRENKQGKKNHYFETCNPSPTPRISLTSSLFPLLLSLLPQLARLYLPGRSARCSFHAQRVAEIRKGRSDPVEGDEDRRRRHARRRRQIGRRRREATQDRADRLRSSSPADGGDRRSPSLPPRRRDRPGFRRFERLVRPRGRLPRALCGAPR